MLWVAALQLTTLCTHTVYIYNLIYTINQLINRPPTPINPHRSLGVHISFVRSIAMDSWTEKQLALMRTGGNQACNDYLQKNGIAPRTPIKQKYEAPAAQLYKEILKARVEGRPEPTELPKPAVRPASNNYNNNNNNIMTGMGSHSSQDPNGMERLMGETDDQYVARQTRLREEAKARMAAKFGGNGGRMGGVGSSGGGAAAGGRMQGIGSDPNYNPNGGYSGGGADLDVNAMISGFGSILGSAVSGAKSLADEQTVNKVKATGASFWGGLTSSVSQLASAIAAPEDGSGGFDGLSDLQRQVAAQRTGNSKYGGFGSDNVMMNGASGPSSFNGMPAGNSFASNHARTGSASSMNSMGSRNSSGGGGAGPQEAPGLPGEDRNGVERLTGETDEQYVVRQMRLRDEARARMAAKFGGGGMGGVGSSSGGGGGASSIASAPGSGNLFTVSSSSPNRLGIQSAPGSGNAPRLNTASGFPRPKTPPKKVMNSNDFFSSFGE